MGLAASQARLLLLTARRSDLEYRAQMISQRKIALAMETEQIANEYTRALNNRKLEFTYQIQENNKTTKTVDLSYRELLFGSELSNYRVVDQNGNIVCLNKENEKGRYSAADQARMIEMPGLAYDNWFQEALQAGTLIIEKKEQDYVKDPVYIENAPAAGAQPKQLSKAEFDALPEADKAKYTAHSETVFRWDAQVLSGMSDIASVLNSDDDNAAMAKYESKSLEVQTMDKQLDVELKQVETQLEACKSEQESVKKLIQDRAQNDFKSFA